MIEENDSVLTPANSHRKNLVLWFVLFSFVPLLAVIILNTWLPLKTSAFIAFAITVIAAFPVGRKVHADIIHPFRYISLWLGDLAHGDTRRPPIAPPTAVSKSTFDEMGQHIYMLAAALEEITETCEAITAGDFSRPVKLKSEADYLGKAVNSMVSRFKDLVKEVETVTAGNFSVTISPRSEQDALATALQAMTTSQCEMVWLKEGLIQLNSRMGGRLTVPELAGNIIRFITARLNAQVGFLYLSTPEGMLKSVANYGLMNDEAPLASFEPGEGVVGKAARENRITKLTDIPEGAFKIRLGMGEIVPRNIIAVPFSSGDMVIGVLEIASMHEITEIQHQFLEQARESIGIALNSVAAREKLEELLQKTQHQAEELQAQQEELRVTNEELEERTLTLQQQKISIQQKSEALQKTRNELEVKAKELELANKYKSAFLANMSHELRTPLNSILILSKLLSDKNVSGLEPKQREFAQMIHDSGSDLLALINEILDLSKIEAGMMEIQVEKVNLEMFVQNIQRVFKPVASSQGVALSIKRIKKNMPDGIFTDSHRFQQVVNNLLSNAFKFTEKGSVTVRIGRPRAGVDLSASGLSRANAIAVSVTDTGIGIPKDKQKAVFEAFQQRDGTTARKYGGTGLGLTISQELARLLGGEIHLQSQQGKGSTFTFYIPERLQNPPQVSGGTESYHVMRNFPIVGERRINEGDRRVNLEDRRQNANGRIPRGGDRRRRETPRRQGLEDRRDHAQWAYQNSVEHMDETGSGIGYDNSFANNRHNSLLHSPQSASGNGFQNGSQNGSQNGTQNAARNGSRTIHSIVLEIRDDRRNIKVGDKSLLVIENDPELAKLIISFAQEKGFKCIVAEDGEIGLHFADFYKPAAIILDPRLPGITGREVRERLKKNPQTGRIPVHAVTPGAAGLLPDITLFLHQVEEEFAEPDYSSPGINLDREAVMAGKKILIVDDDMRNVFALTSIMEEKGMGVIVGTNGRKGLEKLREERDVDLVIMDIMMPVMDGYEAMREIRKEKRFQNLPIIALTAKAMKGDRNKCIAAGASDYLAKPVEADKLLSLLRVWLYK